MKKNWIIVGAIWALNLALLFACIVASAASTAEADFRRQIQASTYQRGFFLTTNAPEARAYLGIESLSVTNGGLGQDLTGSLDGALLFYDRTSVKFQTAALAAYTNAITYTLSSGLLSLYRTNSTSARFITLNDGGGVTPVVDFYADKLLSANTNFSIDAGSTYAIRLRVGTVSQAEISATAFRTFAGFVLNRFATATNYTLTATNCYVVATATCTNTLPAASALTSGGIVTIKNKGGTTTVRPAGSDTIDGVAGDDPLTAKASHTYISDGVSNWEVN